MKICRPCILALAVSVIAVSGCSSSLTSTKLTDEEFQQGLVYYLPKKDVIVSVTRNKKGELSVDIQESPMYPDLESLYRLEYKHNIVGKSTMKIGIGPNGLLASANSTVESGIATSLSNLASLSGAIRPMAGQPQDTCAAIGTYSELFRLDGTLPVNKSSRCGVKVTISLWAQQITPVDATDTTFEHSAQSGLYYRQNQPFLVEASWSFNNNGTVEKGSTSKLVLSPSRSSVRFLPIKKSLFSGNVATLGFEDGIPTKYEQDVDSEIAAFLSLPAAVIASYFDAIGEAFDNRKGVAEKERLLLEAELALAQKERDATVCRAAIALDNTEAIEEACN